MLSAQTQADLTGKLAALEQKTGDQVVVAAGAREGHTAGDRQNSWVIDSLTTGDVMVTDLFGKIENGTMVGDNLGTAVASRTGVGAVIDGPAVIEEKTSTTVLYPAQHAIIDAYLNIEIEVQS